MKRAEPKYRKGAVTDKQNDRLFSITCGKDATFTTMTLYHTRSAINAKEVQYAYQS
jgi:hypothetical protein